MYAISIDTDWAPDPLIEKTRDILDGSGITATFFCTNQHGVDLGGHELAIHPNVLDRLVKDGTTPAQTISELKNAFPNARGVRCHSLTSSTRLYPLYRQQGLEYESSHLCYGQHGLRPYWMIEKIVQLPLFWEDDLHMELADQWGHQRFYLEDLHIDQPGLKIFNFHPIHVWLNTESLDRYVSAKPSYHEPAKLLEYENHNHPGTRDFFLDVLIFLKQHRAACKTLGQIADDWRAKQRRQT